MLTALRGVTSHEDAPTCLFSKEAWRGLKGVGRGVFGAFGEYLVGLRGVWGDLKGFGKGFGGV